MYILYPPRSAVSVVCVAVVTSPHNVDKDKLKFSNKGKNENVSETIWKKVVQGVEWISWIFTVLNKILEWRMNQWQINRSIYGNFWREASVIWWNGPLLQRWCAQLVLALWEGDVQCANWSSAFWNWDGGAGAHVNRKRCLRSYRPSCARMT